MKKNNSIYLENMQSLFRMIDPLTDRSSFCLLYGLTPYDFSDLTTNRKNLSSLRLDNICEKLSISVSKDTIMTYRELEELLKIIATPKGNLKKTSIVKEINGIIYTF
jgi:hypothetical protein